MADEFPRVQVMRGAKRKGTRYFGPYAHAWAIRETVDLLLRVFPVRTCSAGVFRRAKQQGRPCLLGYIDKCSAPCVGRISPDDHHALAQDFCDFMAGRHGQVHAPPDRADEGGGERARLRAGRAPPRRHPDAGEGDREERRRARGRDRRGHLRAVRRRARGRGPGVPRPGRPHPRSARLGGREGRGRHGRRAGGAPAAADLRQRGVRRRRRRLVGRAARGARPGAAAGRRAGAGVARRPAREQGVRPRSRSAGTSASSRRPSCATRSTRWCCTAPAGRAT